MLPQKMYFFGLNVFRRRNLNNVLFIFLCKTLSPMATLPHRRLWSSYLIKLFGMKYIYNMCDLQRRFFENLIYPFRLIYQYGDFYSAFFQFKNIIKVLNMENVLFQNETFTSKTIWSEKLMVMWIQVCSNRDLLG